MLFENKTGPGFFEARYREKGDPWNFVGSDYEQDRFSKIAAALAHRRYSRAFEPGCSIGTLTERLAAFCDQVDAFDFSPTAIATAKERCATLPNVQIACSAFGPETQLGGYDLVLFSEIGYYFSARRWRAMVSDFVGQMAPGTTVLASHWLGESRDHRQSGDAVHETLRGDERLHLDHEERYPRLRLDRFTRT